MSRTNLLKLHINPLSANSTKWSNTLKQSVHDKGTADSASTLLHKALVEGYTANSDILD